MSSPLRPCPNMIDAIWPDQPAPPLGPLPVIGFAGRLVPKKGVDVLLHAMVLLRKRVPEVRLIVAGDGPERIGLERLAAELGIRDAVDFLGHLAQDQAEHALGAAWVQAVPSRWEEPFGLVAAEAMDAMLWCSANHSRSKRPRRSACCASAVLSASASATGCP